MGVLQLHPIFAEKIRKMRQSNLEKEKSPRLFKR